jgi:hypothetical protein
MHCTPDYSLKEACFMWDPMSAGWWISMYSIKHFCSFCTVHLLRPSCAAGMNVPVSLRLQCTVASLLVNKDCMKKTHTVCASVATETFKVCSEHHTHSTWVPFVTKCPSVVKALYAAACPHRSSILNSVDKVFQHIQVFAGCQSLCQRKRVQSNDHAMGPHHILTLGLSLMCSTVAWGCADTQMCTFCLFTFPETWNEASSENMIFLRNLASSS